jgi:mono/diheme cytochrome c family protein
MTMAHYRRLAVLLAGLALFVVVVLRCDAGPAETSAADDRPALPDGANPTTVSTTNAAPGQTQAAASAATSIQVYRASCLDCHDSDGRGGIVRDDLPTIPDFTDAKWHASRNDAELSRSILEGKGKSMPRMKKKLGSVDVKQMVAFVRGFQGGKQVVEDEPGPAVVPPQQPVASSLRSQQFPLAPVRVVTPGVDAEGKLYRRFCARCHEQGGKGVATRESLPTIPDFTRPEWQNSRSDAQLRVSIRDGKGTAMPAFREKVEPQQVRGLVAFIRSLGPARPGKAPAASNEFHEELEKLYKEFEELRARSKKLSEGPAKTAAPQEAGPPELASFRPD